MVSLEDLPQEVLIGISLFFALVLAWILFSSSKNSKPSEKKVASSVRGSASKTAGAGTGRYTAAEVAVHNLRDDCWLIVDKKVYDVTAYVDEHPGADAILNNAGGDSTVGFKGPQHPDRVFDQLDLYYIGDLVD